MMLAEPIQKIRPPRVQVEESLEALIKSLSPGQQLPPEPTLARQLGVSRATLREVIRTFMERGLLVRRHGVGTFVALHLPVLETGLEVLESIDQMAHRLGLQTEIASLEIVARPANRKELAGLLLDVNARIEVWCVTRVAAVAANPVAYLSDVVPTSCLTRAELDAAFRGSVLEVFLAHSGSPIAYSRTELSALCANASLAALLHTNVGAALLHLEARLYNWDEQVLDYSHSYFLPDYFQFHVIRRVRPS